MKFHYYMFILLFFASFFLIGGGITGKAISESCCFPPNCEPENVCDAAKAQYLESPTGVTDYTTSLFVSIIGFFVLLGTLSLLYLQHRVKNKRKKFHP